MRAQDDTIYSTEAADMCGDEADIRTTGELIAAARAAKISIAGADTAKKNALLMKMADKLIDEKISILAANELDMQAAKGSIPDVMLDRLKLTSERIDGMAEGMRQAAALPDPVGIESEHITRPNGISIRRLSVPMGVIAIIYESRPNVTSDAAALALKAGSSCVLRCGKEAHRSARAIVRALRAGIAETGMNPDILVLIEDTSRESSRELMTARGQIDLLIPRGGKGLIAACVENATVPVIETGTGICHVYVDASADQDKALKIIENARCSRPSVCNSEEVCVVHRAIADEFLPKLKRLLVDDRRSAGQVPVELRLDAIAQTIIPGTPAGPDDFDTEFNDYILAIKIVDDVRGAIEHINAHSTGHSDAIVTEDADNAAMFERLIDSAAVYVNVSTRFTDGGEFGLGCEMGISTQKLHARGPMGLRELCSYKYVIEGDGQIR